MLTLYDVEAQLGVQSANRSHEGEGPGITLDEYSTFLTAEH